MKFNILTVVLALVAVEASVVPYSTNDVFAYSTYNNNGWPSVSATSDYGYGLYGKTIVPAVAAYYPQKVYGGYWPVYHKIYGYSQVLRPATVAPEVLYDGLWDYGPYGYGLRYSKYW